MADGVESGLPSLSGECRCGVGVDHGWAALLGECVLNHCYGMSEVWVDCVASAAPVIDVRCGTFAASVAFHSRPCCVVPFVVCLVEGGNEHVPYQLLMMPTICSL